LRRTRHLGNGLRMGTAATIQHEARDSQATEMKRAQGDNFDGTLGSACCSGDGDGDAFVDGYRELLGVEPGRRTEPPCHVHGT
jgi:hypothetical protein